MGGLPKFGSTPEAGPLDARPSMTVPKRDDHDISRESQPEGYPFGEIDFDAIGFDADIATLNVTRSAEDKTEIAGVDVLARAIAQTRSTALDASHGRPTRETLQPPSSRSRNARSASDVVPRHDHVAAVRDLYANGDAEAALAIASELASNLEARGIAALFGNGIPATTSTSW
jgi:hypothetical protein